MTTSRTTRPAGRVGLTRFLGNLVDDTKDFIDDVLDRGDEVERDLRGTARRTFREDERDRDDRDAARGRDDDRQELALLREQLDELAEKISRLSSAEEQPQAARTS
ncbi:hypothetical protein LZG04_26705 [Saccharothrix sp. S26]|uniref:hypothetical protein n=1 Tax=Saccharothrix sp. S26 TaxID=2907215 RepID=UPI001F1785C0|nr:hypothetical protein [Saccharothrix sp. S26]MCE6998362.1 hypothetical protein [Saccharothrix sp. S26]